MSGSNADTLRYGAQWTVRERGLIAQVVIGLGLVAIVGCHDEFVRSPQHFPEGLQGLMVHTQAYAAQRREVTAQLAPLAPDADAEAIAAHEQSLIAALRAARSTARQGDIIDREAAAALRRLLRDMPRNTWRELRSSPDEPTTTPLRVNAAYPEDAPVVTMPPSLLRSLPPLPEELQFRIVGRALVLLDWPSRLIVDFLPDALPS